MTCAQFRGYLFEKYISQLLNKNGFIQCEYDKDNYTSLNLAPCEIISQDYKIQGRGTRHQIDYVGIYKRNIPFVYPIRILVECKYYIKGVYKSVIREFLGTYKDIEENYFYDQRDNRVRFLNVPILFSATTFQEEAINLAWVHGINTISYYKIPILKKYFSNIESFVDNNCRKNIDSEKAKKLQNEFLDKFPLPKLETFLFATTERGLLINLISTKSFPDELFYERDENNCGIYFEENEGVRVFYLQFNDDKENRKFYFQVHKELLKKEFSSYSLDKRINMKLKYFRRLTLIKKINGIDRIIKLKVDFDSIKEFLK